MTAAPAHAPDEAEVRPVVPAARPAVTLPPAFEAFYALHCARYLGYALAHVAEPWASRAVGEAMGEVAIRWADIVRCPNPAACAWALVRTRIRRRSGGTGAGVEGAVLCHPSRSGLRRSALRYDAFVLHEVLGHSLEDTAEAMGEEISRVRCALGAGRGRVRAETAGRAAADRLPGVGGNTPHG
ncbi:hypothetical protein ACFU7T_02230 [Streptomyces sp. NPDC057555]|uniref:hypothetical protein n=1 Tax=Streptomyces sp. NPDC057555 TaxID=3346166 RepID=UPI00367A7D93